MKELVQKMWKVLNSFVHDKTSEKLVESGFSSTDIPVCVSHLNPSPTLTDKNVCATAEEVLSCTKVKFS